MVKQAVTEELACNSEDSLPNTIGCKESMLTDQVGVTVGLQMTVPLTSLLYATISSNHSSGSQTRAQQISRFVGNGRYRDTSSY